MPAEALRNVMPKMEVIGLHMSYRLAHCHLLMSSTTNLSTTNNKTLQTHKLPSKRRLKRLHHIRSGEKHRIIETQAVNPRHLEKGFVTFVDRPVGTKQTFLSGWGYPGYPTRIPHLYIKLSLYSKLYFCWVHDSTICFVCTAVKK